jgi:phage-related protein (TIGR01555 family)
MSETESMSQPVPTRDSYENFVARMGTNESNQSGAGTYKNNWTSRNRLLVEQSYRSSWLVGAGVDAIPDDMTRKGITITSKLEDGRKKQLDNAWDEMGIWEALNDTLKWARLYGGAVGVILIDGQNYSTPLRIDAIEPGAFKGVMVMDRWMLNATTERRVTELGPEFGMPEFYRVVTSATGIPPWRIHHSRLIRFDGIPLPYQQRLTENDWGMSVIERCFDRLLAFDSTTQGVAQLIYKAHLRTYSIKDFRKLLAFGKDNPAYKALLSHMDMIRQFQSNEGMTLMDADDKFEAHTYSYAGLSDVLAQFGQQVSGAFGIPLVRLFGQSPAGFSTGDTDLSNYYDNVSTQQERKLRRPIRKLFEVLHMSLFAKPLPDDFSFEFNELWQTPDSERADTATKVVAATVQAVDAGLMTEKAGAMHLQETARVTGLGGTISDEDIDNASDLPPPSEKDLDNVEASKPEEGGKAATNTATTDSPGSRSNRRGFLRWIKR